MLERATCARIPKRCLGALAPVRALPDVRVSLDGDQAWVLWRSGQDAVLRALVPVPGAAFFVSENDSWRRAGSRLPCSEAPPATSSPLRDFLPLPALEAVPPLAAPLDPVPLRLVPSETPRPTTAVLAPFEALRAWADRATTAELERARGARTGDLVLVRGERVPPLAGGERLSGESVLVPLGRRCDPDLPEAELRAALGLEPGELALVFEDRIEVVPERALRSLTRAGIRLGARP